MMPVQTYSLKSLSKSIQHHWSPHPLKYMDSVMLSKDLTQIFPAKTLDLKQGDVNLGIRLGSKNSILSSNMSSSFSKLKTNSILQLALDVRNSMWFVRYFGQFRFNLNWVWHGDLSLLKNRHNKSFKRKLSRWDISASFALIWIGYDMVTSHFWKIVTTNLLKGN